LHETVRRAEKNEPYAKKAILHLAFDRTAWDRWHFQITLEEEKLK